MQSEIRNAVTLISEEKYQEAYEKLSMIIKNNPRINDAYYYRGFVDLFYLKKSPQQTFLDFKTLINNKSKYAKQILPYYIIVCEEISCDQEIITYGKEAMEVNELLRSDVRSSYINALARSNELSRLQEALQLLDEAITEYQEDDVNSCEEYYYKKIDILINIGEIEEASKCLDLICTKFSSSGILYHFKGRLLIKQFEKTKNIEDINQAIENLKFALEYNNEDLESLHSLSIALAQKGNLEEAFKTIDRCIDLIAKLKKSSELEKLEVDGLVEKVFLCEMIDQIDEAKKLFQDELEKNDSWQLKWKYASFLYYYATSKEDVELSRNYLMEAFNHDLNNVHDDVYHDLLIVNNLLNYDNENLELINQRIKENPNDGQSYYYLGETLLKLGRTYDEVFDNYTKAYELDAISSDHFLSIAGNISKNPKLYDKLIIKGIKGILCDYDVWTDHKYGIRYLYGENGLKTNLSKALNIFRACILKKADNPCMFTGYGMALELNKNDPKGVFEVFLKAYNLYQKKVIKECNCACGYMARAYLEGIGVKKDLKIAKNYILEGINDLGKLSSSIVILYYGYFALLGEEGFSLEKAMEYLKQDYSFIRYDMSRALMMNAIAKKLNLDPIYQEKDLKLILKYSPKDINKYYKEYKNQEIIKPYYKSF